MVFSDLFFIYVFIPAFAIFYLLSTLIDKRCNSEKRSFTYRNICLVIFSLLFYAWGEAVYVLLMLGCVAINYFAGLGIAKSERHSKLWLVIGLILDISLIGTFKYLGFITDTLSCIGIEINAPRLALPIGISFYTFQAISYLVDVYRKESPVQKRFIDLLLYISMFPQLIAGPIVRYGTVAKEINDRHVDSSDFAAGAYRFFTGLAKKVVFANILSEISTKFLVTELHQLSTAGAWIGIIAFTLQIYFDFSGYSDMAIGLGRCVGFHFCENFNHPYCCTTITDFWRRWHMSLGSFFRDYVYIPLGGNRKHQIMNIMIVWFLTGMWHGASWNFIIWGVYFGIFVTLEKYTILRWKWLPTIVSRIYALIVVVLGWGIFYFDNFSEMITFFTSLFGCSSTAIGYIEESTISEYFWLLISSLILCIPIHTWLNRWIDSKIEPSSEIAAFGVSLFRALISIAILGLSTALLVGATNNAFIYTRF